MIVFGDGATENQLDHEVKVLRMSVFVRRDIPELILLNLKSINKHIVC